MDVYLESCKHYVKVDNICKCMSGVDIYKMLKKDGLSDEHFNGYSNWPGGSSSWSIQNTTNTNCNII
jgi:hypothetical protein